jgi:hypothetical protein
VEVAAVLEILLPKMVLPVVRAAVEAMAGWPLALPAQAIHQAPVPVKAITVVPAAAIPLRIQLVAAVVQEPLVPPVLVLLRVQAVLEHNPASLEQQHTTQVAVVPVVGRVQQVDWEAQEAAAMAH